MYALDINQILTYYQRSNDSDILQSVSRSGGTMSKMIDSLGVSLAQAIGKEEMVCRGLLRLTIMDSVAYPQKTSDYGQTMVYVKKMSYQDWKDIIEGPALARRLRSVGIKDPAAVVNVLRQTLVEQQSLLTMGAL
jgi:hypothetical protein